jgi:hypothetical protein
MSSGGGTMSSINSCKSHIIDVALFSEAHLKPHEMFFIPNDPFYQAGHFPGRKGIPDNYVDLWYMCDMYT